MYRSRCLVINPTGAMVFRLLVIVLAMRTLSVSIDLYFCSNSMNLSNLMLAYRHPAKFFVVVFVATCRAIHFWGNGVLFDEKLI